MVVDEEDEKTCIFYTDMVSLMWNSAKLLSPHLGMMTKAVSSSLHRLSQSGLSLKIPNYV